MLGPVFDLGKMEKSQSESLELEEDSSSSAERVSFLDNDEQGEGQRSTTREKANLASG